MKYIFENRLGRLAYECQTLEDEQKYSEMDTGDIVNQIEEEKIESAFRSVNTTMDCPPSPKKKEFLEARRLDDTFNRADSQFLQSVSNFEAIYEEMDKEVPITFEK